MGNKKFFLFIGLIYLPLLSMSQTTSPSVITTGGSSFKNGSVSLSWTIGEAAYTQISSGRFKMKQGFQQPFSQIRIRLRAFIEGYYKGAGTMTSSITSGVNSVQCDSVILSIAKPVFPYSILATDTAVISTEGYATFRFNKNIVSKHFYLIINHRNTLGVWTATPIHIKNDSLIDLSQSAAMVYGGNEKPSTDGRFLLISGDVNQDGTIDQTDLMTIEQAAINFHVGYLPADLTGDWVVESADYSLVEGNLTRSVIRP